MIAAPLAVTRAMLCLCEAVAMPREGGRSIVCMADEPH